MSDGDYLVLEDGTGNRTVLIGIEDDQIASMSSGMVVALIGHRDSGKFKVLNIIYPGMAPQKPLPERDDDLYILIASGIDTVKPEHVMFNRMLAGYIKGIIGGEAV